MKLVSLLISVILCTSPLSAGRRTLKIKPAGVILIAGGCASFYQARYHHRHFLQSKREFESGSMNYRSVARPLLFSLGLAAAGVTASLWGTAIAFDVSKDTKRIEIGWRFD